MSRAAGVHAPRRYTDPPLKRFAACSLPGVWKIASTVLGIAPKARDAAFDVRAPAQAAPLLRKLQRVRACVRRTVRK